MLYILVEKHMPKLITQALAITTYAKVVSDDHDDKMEYAIWVMTESGPGEFVISDSVSIFVVEDVKGT